MSEQAMRDYMRGMLRIMKPHMRPGLNTYQILLDNARFIPAGQVVTAPDMLVPQACINNSLTMTHKYGPNSYIEGFAIVHMPLRHAWNLHPDGYWIDHTLCDSEQWDYFGLQIPTSVVLAAAIDPAWELCVGILEVLECTRDEELRNMAAYEFKKLGYVVKMHQAESERGSEESWGFMMPDVPMNIQPRRDCRRAQ